MDTEKLRKLVKHFSFSSAPSIGAQSDPCTIEDLNRVIKNATRVLNAIIDELENDK